jgi:hypothetical protein
MKQYLIILSTVSLLIILPYKAYSFYCGNELVTEGDIAAEVYLKCGEPLWRDRHVEEGLDLTRHGIPRTVYIEVEEWLYNFGSFSWMYYLRFENGKLVKIETRGYGY